MAPSDWKGAVIFINFRSSDSIAYPHIVDKDLTARFGREHVFIHWDHELVGSDWYTRMLRQVAASKALVALIGPSWGRDPRLYAVHDIVRGEIPQAFASGVAVVPVAVNGAAVPSANDALPPALAQLPFCTGVILSDGRNQPQDIDHLVRQLAEVTCLAARTGVDGKGPEDRIYKPDFRTWQWQGTLNARADEAFGLLWHAFNAAVAEPLKIQRTGPTAFASLIVDSETWLTGEVVPGDIQARVIVTVRDRSIIPIPDPKALILRRYTKPIKRMIQVFEQSGRLV